MKKPLFTRTVKAALLLVSTGPQSRRGAVVISFLITSVLSPAQFYCFQGPPGPDPAMLNTACGASINYAPTIPEHTPIKTCRIAIHSFQLDNGTGNFQNTTADRQYLDMVVLMVNNRLGNLGILNMGSSPYIQDSRIRIHLDAVYFHPHTVDWNYASASAMYTKYVAGDYDNYGMTIDDKENVEHIFLSGSTGTFGGHASAIGEQGYLSLVGWYPHFLSNGPTSYSWAIPGHFVHEFGHAIGLNHNFQNCFACPSEGSPEDQCDSCSDNDPTGLACPDVGTSSNYMDYQPGGYNNSNPDPGFSACQLGRAHYRLDGNTGSIGDIVVKDYCTYAPNESISILSSTTWLSSKRLQGDLIIEPGATLTIKCRVHLPFGARVIVKPGAKLTVDEGLLTNLCGQFWSGIEVWGDNTHNQLPSIQPTYQGMVVLKNGATIEHAREAIVLGQDGVWNTFGGVVRATDAHFINCRRAVAFGPYQNTTNGGTPIGNRSFFARCDFAVDNNYRGGEDFHAHVSMWKVDGITFTACDFKNQQTTITESAKLGCGIVSIDASYRILGQCTTNPPWVGDVCPSYTPTTFIGLDHGINARNFCTTRSFIVDHGLFEDNVCGVYANGVVGFQVRNSQFKVGGNEVADLTNSDEDNWFDRHRAVFSTESWAFAIDDNTVEQSGIHDLTEGIVVGYSHDHNDVVFRNQATGLERGYIGEGICADPAPGYTATRGLWFLCNGNSNNETNFSSRKVTSAPLAEQPDHTIRLNQGTPSRPADNTFDQWPLLSANWDFRVSTTNSPISYWHRNTGNFVPVHYTQSLTGLFPAVSTALPANNCLSKVQTTIPWNPNYPSGIAPGPVVNYLLSEKLAFGNTRYLYEQLIDDGNTDEVVEEIQESWPQDAWSLRDYLLSKSPYLSATSLKEMVLHNILPAAMVTEILVANPEATRQDGFLRWLQEDSGHPLPEYMLGMVVASWDQRTYRDALEGAMTFHHAEMTQAANMLLHHYQTLPLAEEDTTSVPMDSVLWVWQQVRTPAARYAEALTWLQLGNYVQATGVIEAIPAEHDLRSPEALERQRMLDLISFLQVLNGVGRSEMQLTSGEVATLQALMGEAYDRPAAWISNLLCFGYQLCRPPLTGGEEEDDRRSLPYTALSSNAALSQAALSIHPNPASTWVVLDYDLLVEPTEAALAIRDLTGREVYRRTLTDRKQEVVWDTRQIAPGSYTVVLLNGGRQLRAEKLIIRQ